MINIVHEVDGLAVEKVTECGYILRGYSCGKKYPDGFDWIVVALIDRTIATLKGFLHIKGGNGSIKHARMVDTFLKSLGCKKLVYERVKDGVVINVTRRL